MFDPEAAAEKDSSQKRSAGTLPPRPAPQKERPPQLLSETQRMAVQKRFDDGKLLIVKDPEIAKIAGSVGRQIEFSAAPFQFRPEIVMDVTDAVQIINARATAGFKARGRAIGKDQLLPVPPSNIPFATVTTMQSGPGGTVIPTFSVAYIEASYVTSMNPKTAQAGVVVALLHTLHEAKHDYTSGVLPPRPSFRDVQLDIHKRAKASAENILRALEHPPNGSAGDAPLASEIRRLMTEHSSRVAALPRGANQSGKK